MANGAPGQTSIRLLFVCGGNTCRSPMAAGFAAKLLAGRAVVDSAGLDAADGSPATPKAVRAMKELGIDITTHRSRDVASLSLGDYQYIVALHASVGKELTKRYGVRVDEVWDIEDPFEEDAAVYRKRAQEIRVKVEGLVRRLGTACV